MNAFFFFFDVWLILNYLWSFLVYYTTKCTAVYCNEIWGTGDHATMAAFPKEASYTVQSVVRRTEFVNWRGCTLQQCGQTCLPCPSGKVIDLSYKLPVGQTSHKFYASLFNSWFKLRVFCTVEPLSNGWFSIHQKVCHSRIHPSCDLFTVLVLSFSQTTHGWASYQQHHIVVLPLGS